METNFIFGISLTASFLAGVLALFAPCCITFLFPSYLGTIFKESNYDKSKKNRNVMFYTLVFAFGLAVILIPVALGLRFFIYFFDFYHKEVYYIGGLFLIMMGVMTFKPLFHLPQLFHSQPKLAKKVNLISVFSLGLMSGLTSSCCAPVLFAAVTLTTLSPSLLQAVVVSFAYVLGIVFPLFILSLFYEKLTGKISGENRQKIYRVFQYLGSGIFVVSGILIIILNYFNKIQMYQMEGTSRSVRLFVFNFAKYFKNPLVDIGTFIIILVTFYKLLKRSHEKNN